MTNPTTGDIYKVGEVMRRPKLANTLDIIAQEGPDAFYNGSLAKNITDDIAEAGTIKSLVNPLFFLLTSDSTLKSDLGMQKCTL